jgi:hypothetical protein
VEALKPLGKGFTVFELGRRMMIRSVPKELNTDQSTVLEAIQVGFSPQPGEGKWWLMRWIGAGVCDAEYAAG